MRRGIIRIVSGIVLILLQVLSLLGQSSADTLSNQNFLFYIGFFSPAIIGITLLIVGSRTYGNEIYSELVLHKNTSILHTITKWVGFVLSLCIFLIRLLSFVWIRSFSIVCILDFFSALSFCAYALFYMYKKPSCLFSATLIFTGVACIYGSFISFSASLFSLLDTDASVPLFFAGILPKLVAGILYIVIAAILYKEDFPVDVIKTLGWTTFALDALGTISTNLIVLQGRLFASWLDCVFLLFAVIFLLYISVFKLNSLQDLPASVRTDNHSFVEDTTPSVISGWRCSCGRIHPSYVSSCACGNSKPSKTAPPNTATVREAVATPPAAPKPSAPPTPPAPPAQIRFCRKCGEKLIESSQFCHKCGKEII